MAIFKVIFLLLLSTPLLADSPEERALQLNEEMEYLMGVAAKPKVWSSGNLPPRSRRSGPAPSQMEGIENIEDRFFTDEVNLKAAKAAETTDREVESTDLDEEEADYRVDGSVPKKAL
jgi:hypothetical protein